MTAAIKPCNKCHAPMAATANAQCVNCSPTKPRGRRHYTTTYTKQSARLRRQANNNPAFECQGAICLWEQDGYGRTQQPNNVDQWQTDHDQPGNPDSPLLVLHGRCNRDKGNKTNQQWVDSRKTAR